MALKLITESVEMSQIAERVVVLRPVDQYQSKYLDYCTEVQGSACANSTFAYLRKHERKIGILITAEFASTYMPPFAILPRTAATYSGGIVIVQPGCRIMDHYPIGISLCHELGHAKQFLSNPDWFEPLFNSMVEGIRNDRVNRRDNKAKYDIEDHNVEHHEYPVCVELGIKPGVGAVTHKDSCQHSVCLPAPSDHVESNRLSAGRFFEK